MMARNRIYIVVESGYEHQSIEYVGMNWEAMVAFVSTYEWGGSDAPRIEIWDLFTDSRKPVQVVRPQKVERYVVPEEPESDG